MIFLSTRMAFVWQQDFLFFLFSNKCCIGLVSYSLSVFILSLVFSWYTCSACFHLLTSVKSQQVYCAFVLVRAWAYSTKCASLAEKEKIHLLWCEEAECKGEMWHALRLLGCQKEKIPSVGYSWQSTYSGNCDGFFKDEEWGD